jgi:hypothetical protein
MKCRPEFSAVIKPSAAVATVLNFRVMEWKLGSCAKN